MAHGANSRQGRRGASAPGGRAAGPQEAAGVAQPQGAGAPQEQHDWQLVAAERGARLAQAAQQLRTLEGHIAQLLVAVPSGPEQAATIAALNVSTAILRLLLDSAPAAPPASPRFPLFNLPLELRARVCQVDPAAAPALRLASKALLTYTPARRLRPIQSPDQTDSAFRAALTRPARIAPLTSLDLTHIVADFNLRSDIITAAGSHCAALQTLALPSTFQLQAITTGRYASTLKTLHIDGFIDNAAELSPLATLRALSTLRLTLQSCWFRLHPNTPLPDPNNPAQQADPVQATAQLLNPVCALTQLTRFDLHLRNWSAPSTPAGALLTTALPLISASLPNLVHLSLLPGAPYDARARSHLPSLSALTALGIGNALPPADSTQHQRFYQTIRTLPRLAALTLLDTHGLPHLPILFQRASRAPTLLSDRLRSLAINHQGSTPQPLSLLTAALGAAPSLTHLALEGRWVAPAQPLRQLLAGCPALRSLSLAALASYPDTLFTLLSRLDRLSALTVLSCRQAASNNVKVPPLGRLRNLESLETDLTCGQGLEAIGKLTRLTRLQLHGVRGGLRALGHLTSLQRLGALHFVGIHRCMQTRTRCTYDFDTESPGFYEVLMQLAALQQCTHPDWGDNRACSGEDLRRRFAWKSVAH